MPWEIPILDRRVEIHSEVGDSSSRSWKRLASCLCPMYSGELWRSLKSIKSTNFLKGMLSLHCKWRTYPNKQRPKRHPQPYSGNLEWVVFLELWYRLLQKILPIFHLLNEDFSSEKQAVMSRLRRISKTTLTKGSATTLPFSEENQSLSLFDKAVFASAHLEGFCFFLWSALKIIRCYLNIWRSCDLGPQSSFSLLSLGHSSILVFLCTLIMLLLNWFPKRGLEYYIGTACEAPVSASVLVAT